MLNVEFKQIENVVLMKVLEQGNEIELNSGCFFEYGDVKLCSASHPQIFLYSLYVKGKSERAQDTYASMSFNTPEEAAEYIAKFTECINAYNESVKDKDLLWKPNIDDEYYNIRGDYEYINCSRCYFDDLKLIKNFGAFKTKEQAEKVRKHSILMNLLWQLKFALCPDYEFDLNSTHNSFIRFNRVTKKFECDSAHNAYDFITPVFDGESCLKAVEYLNNYRELWEDLV